MKDNIYKILSAGRTLGLSLDDADSTNVPKWTCFVYKLKENICREEKSKTVLLLIEDEAAKQTQSVFCKRGSSLLHILRENGISLSAYCGGGGNCGKCAVTVRKGELPITAEDKNIFSKEELSDGRRLACRAILQKDIRISIDSQKEAGFKALGIGEADHIKTGRENEHQKGDYGIAIDIGTTTLAFSLLDLHNGRILDTHTAVNSQRAFGADVISRIQAANSGKKEQLQNDIRDDLFDGIWMLAEKNLTESSQVYHIVIAANTVMLHLLRGYSCFGFCRYPFTAEVLTQEELTFEEALGRKFPKAMQPKVTLLPGCSAFVGADITAGLYACGIRESRQTSLFLDLGTNGEMALKTDKGIFVTSTAAGPAFEGGNIKWGIGSVPGAISKVKIEEGVPRVKTILDAAPKGICGTGVIETAAELCTSKIIDQTGKLSEPYFSKGYPLAQTSGKDRILFMQQDIREVQMAKAAIRAGIEILLLRSKTTYEAIAQVFLAGGFGYFLDVEKAAVIGILPKELAGKTAAVGNTSLKGALMYLAEQNPRHLKEIAENTVEISLSKEEKFQDLYLKYMMF